MLGKGTFGGSKKNIWLLSFRILLAAVLLFIYSVNLACKYSYSGNTGMEQVLTQTNVKTTKNKIEPLHQSIIRDDAAPLLVIPNSQTPSLSCRFNSNEIEFHDRVDTKVWLCAEEVTFNSAASDGGKRGPLTMMRFLWTSNYLYFYVEVEQIQPSFRINSEKVWLGDNIEFLIAPRWFSAPFYDEYEFLFNSLSDYTDLHWDKKNTLEDALKWSAKGIEFKYYKNLSFHEDIQGWALQGKIPFSCFDMTTPKLNDYWGLGLFRKHFMNNSDEFLLAWSPPLMNPPKFHTPTKFGMLRFSRAQ